MDFTEDQIHRYARHIILNEVGGVGQTRLLESKVLVIGAGGLGSPVAMYLAAAGVGTLGIVDDDIVDLSNLQRQILHGTSDVGSPKVESAARTLSRLNPEVKVETHQRRLTPDNALDLISAYDLVCDGSDNFATRFLVNDACHLAKKTLVSAAILRFDGQLSCYKTHAGGPCYRCIFKEPPPPESIPSCAQAGVLGAIAGWLGAMQATETLKELLGIGESLSGQLVMVDALSCEMRKIKVKRDPDCLLCSDTSSIRDLSSQDYTGHVCSA
ncbi:MAG: molybdopterin-synthase adenylyltransferase MoeB [Alphaproteobacteria bacterium]|nr:molybdopterin-synthase adenylyltransferase MoeB [Alphaproteobacteria bacterium]